MTLTLTAKYHIASCILTLCFSAVLYYGPDPLADVNPLAKRNGKTLATPSFNVSVKSDPVKKAKSISTLQGNYVFADWGRKMFYIEENTQTWRYEKKWWSPSADHCRNDP